MNALTRFVPLAPLVGLVLASSCNSTFIVSTWKKPDVVTVEFKRVVVIAAARDPANRRAVEDLLVRKLKGRGVASYTLTPEQPVDDELHALIEQRKFDGAIVMRLVSIEKETDWVPGSWTGPYYGYSTPTGSASMDAWGMTSPGRSETETSVRVETNVYELPSETLIWAASSKTVNPKNLKELVDETVEVVTKELRKQGMISPIPVPVALR
jgi:hypothetical protein